MDGNKDDALKCFRIGKEALESGDRSRAVKFLSKARRLDPSLPIDDLLSSAEKEESGQKPGQDAANGPSGSGPTEGKGLPPLRRRVPGTGSGSGSGSYTEEMVTVVRQVKKKKDYYEMLGVERSCSVEDVKKAYRKLSLKVHPDKNTAPGAEEAFKAVSKAFQCLSNVESRRKYDVSGSDEPVYERRHRAHTHGGNGFFYEGDVDADEIFRNFFFGGGMGPATTQFRGFNFGQGMGQRHAGEHAASGGGFNSRTLIQLLPVLLILLVNFMPSSEPVFELSRSHPYEYRFTTEKGVNFYVRSTKFEQDYPSGSSVRARLDQQVERDYFNVLSNNCRLEMQRRQWGYIRETPHCELLEKFKLRLDVLN